MKLNVTLIAADTPLYQEILALRQSVLRAPLGLDIADDDLSDEHNQMILGAFSDDRIIGCVLVKSLGNGCYQLRQMAVAPDFQHRGYGSALLQQAEAFIREKRGRSIILHARKYALPFYLRNGYTTFGEEYTEVGIPHISMEKDL